MSACVGGDCGGGGGGVMEVVMVVVVAHMMTLGLRIPFQLHKWVGGPNTSIHGGWARLVSFNYLVKESITNEHNLIQHTFITKIISPDRNRLHTPSSESRQLSAQGCGPKGQRSAHWHCLPQ